MMPDMTGMDLHEQLTLTMPEPVDRMIFVTGASRNARARGVKPFDMKGLRALIRDRPR